MTDTSIALELSPKLQKEQIVTSYIFDLKTDTFVLELNHKYDKKTIISKIVKDDWTKTIEKFQRQMKQSGVSQEHITMITDVAENQYQDTPRSVRFLFFISRAILFLLQTIIF